MNYFFLIFLGLTFPLLSAEPLPWLSCNKTAIVDEKGSQVTLRGVNLGSWLVEEMWMLPFVTDAPGDSTYPLIQDHVSLWATFEERFGKEKMEEIRSSFREHWIQDQDFKNIKQAGFNAVRLPFLYDLHNEPKGLFYWLDYAVECAERHGLYVILDMHGVPGRQSKNNHTGQVEKGEFFSKGDHQNKTCTLWNEIAKHYKDCPNIAGYDLVNEPMDAPGQTELFKIYDKIYKAVRSEDKRHIIFFQDGYKGIKYMPHPNKNKWQNVAISTHHYLFEQHSKEHFMNKFSEHMKKIEEKQKEVQIPFYLGEFNVAPLGNFETIQSLMSAIHKKKLSYSFWSYKIGRRGHKHSLWALYFAPGRQKNINPFKDSYKAIIKKTKRLSTDHYDYNDELLELFR